MSGRFNKNDSLDHIRQQGHDNQNKGSWHMNLQAWSPNDHQLRSISEPLVKSGYGRFLLRLLDRKVSG